MLKTIVLQQQEERDMLLKRDYQKRASGNEKDNFLAVYPVWGTILITPYKRSAVRGKALPPPPAHRRCATSKFDPFGA